MTIQVGDRLPDVPLAIATPDGPQPINSGEYFAGKRVALFAVPGAFTPTCSARHLPGYVEKAGELKAKGIDEIACTCGQRRLRDGRLGQGDGSATTSPCSPTAMASSPRRVGLTMDGSQVRHGQAQPALFDDRQRRRRRAAQRRGAGRISGVERRDICSSSSRAPVRSHIARRAATLAAVRYGFTCPIREEYKHGHDQERHRASRRAKRRPRTTAPDSPRDRPHDRTPYASAAIATGAVTAVAAAAAGAWFFRDRTSRSASRDELSSGQGRHCRRDGKAATSARLKDKARCLSDDAASRDRRGSADAQGNRRRQTRSTTVDRIKTGAIAY